MNANQSIAHDKRLQTAYGNLSQVYWVRYQRGNSIIGVYFDTLELAQDVAGQIEKLGFVATITSELMEVAE